MFLTYVHSKHFQSAEVDMTVAEKAKNAKCDKIYDYYVSLGDQMSGKDLKALQMDTSGKEMSDSELKATLASIKIAKGDDYSKITKEQLRQLYENQDVDQDYQKLKMKAIYDKYAHHHPQIKKMDKMDFVTLSNDLYSEKTSDSFLDAIDSQVKSYVSLQQFQSIYTNDAFKIDDDYRGLKLNTIYQKTLAATPDKNKKMTDKSLKYFAKTFMGPYKLYFDETEETEEYKKHQAKLNPNSPGSVVRKSDFNDWILSQKFDKIKETCDFKLDDKSKAVRDKFNTWYADKPDQIDTDYERGIRKKVIAPNTGPKWENEKFLPDL